MSLPPDLKVLCRRLTSTPPAQLPHSIPAFINHILRCKDVLSAPHDAKANSSSSEASTLVHKLRTIITTLLNGKSAMGRFTGATLVKAVVDVGGWECLKESGNWVRGLLAMLQKNDPFPVKEVAIVALVRIYTLIQGFQTLTREIATPTLPTFFNACLQLIKLPAAGQRLKTPFVVVETVLDAFSTLIPFYPTTCRPFNGQTRTAIRPYLAPTSSDGITIPQSLQRASRHLAISLHFTTVGKSGPSDDWAKLVEELRKEFHTTADQVFRAVQESWEASVPYTASKVNFDAAPQGFEAPDYLPQWTGISAGRDRLVGLLHYLADALRYSTKASVTIPIGALMDIVSRVSLISRNSKSQSWEQALETHAAVGREEKEELWAAVPDIHIAALELLLVLVQRLDRNSLSLIPEIYDNLVLVFRSGINIPSVRAVAYKLLKETLPIAGPGLQKVTVETLGIIILACCRDIQQESGYVKETKPASKTGPDTKKNGITANADLFLPSQNTDTQTASRPTLDKAHLAAAEALLASLLSYLPQQHLKPGLRGLLDQTAILSHNKDAMLASVLNPFINQGGSMYPSILPYLSQQYPHDQGLEILRSNIRSSHQGPPPDALEGINATLEELEAEEAAKDGEEEIASEIEVVTGSQDEEMREVSESARAGGFSAGTIVVAQEDDNERSNPFRPSTIGESGSIKVANPFAVTSAQKRKHDNEGASPPKRQSVERKAERTMPPEPVAEPAAEPADEGDDSDDESVHLNMDLDDEDEDEE
ncbi:Pre-rRNA-processing protein rix1 [Colletotrichum chlorophyti]|uniref:Pre-rRNA-processing protein RIX1 n=1 Tax=Colletotrichum chlorophyti TaxID=708187 RepID=A0A1Q8RHB5_9PEZI|nr:Pre-rRNA-processing protein rix1 [Colletotrichum chlorophyti]